MVVPLSVQVEEMKASGGGGRFVMREAFCRFRTAKSGAEARAACMALVKSDAGLGAAGVAARVLPVTAHRRGTSA